GSIDYLMVPADTFYNYSNPNFMVAGLIAETIAGKPYRDLVHDQVLAPLGMTRTFFLPSEVLADGDYAIGKTAYQGLPSAIKPDTYDNAWGRPCGYAFSNVLDLAKMAEFLIDGDASVLPKATFDEMETEHVVTQEYLDVLGYGYGVQTYKG